MAEITTPGGLKVAPKSMERLFIQLYSSPRAWVEAFLDLNGVDALSSILEEAIDRHE